MHTITTLWSWLEGLRSLQLLVLCVAALYTASLLVRKGKKEEHAPLAGYWQHFFYDMTVSPAEACRFIKEATRGMEGVSVRAGWDLGGSGKHCMVSVLRIARKGLVFRVSAVSIDGNLLLTCRARHQKHPVAFIFSLPPIGWLCRALSGIYWYHAADVRQAFFESVQAMMREGIKLIKGVDSDRKYATRLKTRMMEVERNTYRPDGHSWQPPATWSWDLRGRQGKPPVRQVSPRPQVP